MRTTRKILGAAAVLAAVPFLTSTTAMGQDETTGWKDTAEFSLVMTGGNTETSALGLKNKLWKRWDKSAFELNAGAIKVETTTVTKTAIGTTTVFSIDEVSSTEKTAENYYLNGRYDRMIHERFFWFVGAGWDRNEFAGIENRYTGYAGVGNIWVQKEKIFWSTDYSASITKQDDVTPDPAIDDTYPGLRLSSAFKYDFGKNASYGNDTIVDVNLNETEDLRVDMTNWLAVSMSEHLALKLSLQVLYDNLPALEAVTLLEFDGLTGTFIDMGNTVPAELDELDTILTASLVINF